MLSWLIPVRDCAALLPRAVDSALAQCGPQDEVVVVDDGSRDHPELVLPSDQRVRLLRQEATGIAVALERGRAACRGGLVARLDADDVALPGRIKAQRQALAADSRLAAVGGQARVHRAGRPVAEGMARYVAWVNRLLDPAQLATALFVESPLFHPAVTLRAQALDAVGGWRQGDFPEDYDLWLRLDAAGHKMMNVDRVVVELEDRPDRLTRTDPRYRRSAFTGLKQAALSQRLRGGSRRLAVWGAGRSGRPWLSWARRSGHDLVAVVDAYAQGMRQGRAIEPPTALVGRPLDLLLVAVGARGARDLIRAELAHLRPDLVEGRDWLAVC